ncbi:OmpH family outer membrane protein [Flavimarina sp. Hel_I_48]|uniref:OmpH family outer membrane protein n=1 Tax=Flavimarina sp. Hel_I_48 TaxID=1392488 RepID=UPI000567E505|nr:OmpH family outer membrane protein [Flavimarina sp. Hel_I_48]
MRKQAFLLSFLVFMVGFCASAQRSMRIGYIDMDYILENVPEYQEAQNVLNAKVDQWKIEIEKKQSSIEQMKKTLENERVLLTEELVAERQEEIAFVENELFEYQQKRFGPQGDLMIQNRTLVEPVQDQVFNAVQELAEARKYDFIFDKSADLVMLYANDRNDVSDQVLLSINRASKRKQTNSRGDRKEVERDDARSVEEEREVTEREKAIDEKQEEREQFVQDRKAERDSLRAAKKREFEERRQRILQEREQRRDSITSAREGGDTETTESAAVQEENNNVPTAEERRKALLQARQARKDSILQARQRIKDSVMQVRQRKKDSIN